MFPTWSREMDELFHHIMNVLDKVEDGIKSLNPKLVTALLTDWCKHGVGFVMMQKHCKCPAKEDGSVNTVCCWWDQGLHTQQRQTIQLPRGNCWHRQMPCTKLSTSLWAARN